MRRVPNTTWPSKDDSELLPSVSRRAISPTRCVSSAFSGSGATSDDISAAVHPLAAREM